MYGSKAVAEKHPYKLGLQIRPFGRTRGTWSNPRRFRPHPPATGPSRLARPPGGRWTPWSGQVPPARQLAPRWAPSSRPPCRLPRASNRPRREATRSLDLGGPGTRGALAPGNPRRSTDECRCGWSSSPPIPRRARLHPSQPSLRRFTAGPRPGGVGLGGWSAGAQIYILTPRTLHPPPSGPPTNLPSQSDNPGMAHSPERRQAPPAPKGERQKRPPPALPGGRPITRLPPRHPTAPTGSAGGRGGNLLAVGSNRLQPRV